MPPKKTVTTTAKTAAKKTTTPRQKSSTNSKSTAQSQIAKNTANIEKNAKIIHHNSYMIHLLYGVIIILLMIITCLAFYVWQILWNPEGAEYNTVNTPTPPSAEKIVITVIDDERCLDCATEGISSQLQNLPFLSQAEFFFQDFRDSGVESYLKENNINALPAIIFSSNILYDSGQISPYLSALPSGEYSLSIGADFDPFANRSENGFLILEKDIVEKSRELWYRKWSADAKILWLEFSDLDCPACRALYTQKTDTKLRETFGDTMAKSLLHFPLDSIHPLARGKAEALECIGSLAGSDIFYDMVEKNYAGNETVESFISVAEEAWLSRSDIEDCIEEGKYKKRVQDHMDFGTQNFGVNSTPSNIIINLETGEYTQVRWAAQVATFETSINRLLGN